MRADTVSQTLTLVNMLEAIEKLLILQDRDRKILQTETELSSIDPQRQALQARLAAAQATLESVKQRARQVESDRKKLELDVEAKKELIGKYSLQQFQTKKNEEYRALAHEIETCKEAIHKIEDQEIELMEKGEALQKEVAVAAKIAADSKREIDSLITDLTAREGNLQKQLEEYRIGREQLAGVVDEVALARYERLFKHKGGKVVVGIEHGVCGGCHMKLPMQLIVSCQAQQEPVACTNCGRILYYTRDMNLAVVD
jgi:uncharacterized protein